MSDSVIAAQPARPNNALHGTGTEAVPMSSTGAHQANGFFRGLMIAVPLAAGFWAALYFAVRALT